MIKLPSWDAIYPQGTLEGDEEQKFFTALSRGKDAWQNTQQISSTSNLPFERVEEIIDKYIKKGLIIQNPTKKEYWGYWERVKKHIPEEIKTISQVDHKKRVDVHLATYTCEPMAIDDFNN